VRKLIAAAYACIGALRSLLYRTVLVVLLQVTMVSSDVAGARKGDVFEGVVGRHQLHVTR
jgi:hypothetical protein